MKKRSYQLLLTALAVANGALFVVASKAAMERGVEGVDNQAGLLLIPLLWIPAAVVVAGLVLFVLLSGGNPGRKQGIHPLQWLRLAGKTGAQRAGRILLWGTTLLLMAFGSSSSPGRPCPRLSTP